MPALVLHRYRDSICYVFGIYQVGLAGRPPELRARISGTGFVVSDGLLVTNRHVAEPWYEDTESTLLIRKGATGVLGMVAKSPPAVYDRLAFRRDDQGAANELAALSLIRPSSTCGHLGDVVGDKLIYDAPTAAAAARCSTPKAKRSA